MSEQIQPNTLLDAEPQLKEGSVLIPTYDPADQYGIEDLETLWPDWRTGEFYEDLDPVVRERETDKELLLLGVVDTYESRRIAADIGLHPRDIGGEGLERAIDQMPREVGLKFDAHGIAGKRDSPSNELDALLKNGIHKDPPLYSMSLLHAPEIHGALGAERPFTEGGLVIVSGKDEKLTKDGIKSVIVGENYLKCVDLLRARYPDTTFVPWHEAPNFFIDMVNADEGTDYKPKKIDYERTFPDKVEHPLFSEPTDAVAGGIATGNTVQLDTSEYDGEDVW